MYQVESWHEEGSKDAGNKVVVGNSHELRRVEEISERGQDFMSCTADDDDDDDDNTIPQITVQIWPLSKM
jgi:hypothetical protein